MSVGEEIFNVADGYNEEMWDDTALIRNYEKAYEASRSGNLHSLKLFTYSLQYSLDF